MTGFDRILAPLDGSDRSEAALRWVRLFPARHVRLLRVTPPDDPAAATAAPYLNAIAGHLDMPGCEVETRVIAGGPADAIVADAADRDLIVMCTQGHGAGGRLVFGSVADRVARHAPIPTLLVRSSGDPVVAEPVRRVVVPLDGSAAAERAVPVAAGLARLLGASVALVTVNDAAATGATCLQPSRSRPRGGDRPRARRARDLRAAPGPARRRAAGGGGTGRHDRRHHTRPGRGAALADRERRGAPLAPRQRADSAHPRRRSVMMLHCHIWSLLSHRSCAESRSSANETRPGTRPLVPRSDTMRDRRTRCGDGLSALLRCCC